MKDGLVIMKNPRVRRVAQLRGSVSCLLERRRPPPASQVGRKIKDAMDLLKHKAQIPKNSLAISQPQFPHFLIGNSRAGWKCSSGYQETWILRFTNSKPA